MRAAATGEARSPTVDSRVRLMISDEDLYFLDRGVLNGWSGLCDVDYFSRGVVCYVTGTYWPLLIPATRLSSRTTK